MCVSDFNTPPPKVPAGYVWVSQCVKNFPNRKNSTDFDVSRRELSIGTTLVGGGLKLMVLPIEPKTNFLGHFGPQVRATYGYLWPLVAYHTPPQAPKHTIYALYTLCYAYTTV